MAVPTIATISPARGHTGGLTLVEIQGTGFRLAPEPPPGVYPVAEPKPTVRVTFGSAEATDVAVESTTVVFAVSPTCPLPMTAGDGRNELPNPPVVSVTVQNLDDDGVAILGEVVTIPNAFMFLRPDLSLGSHGTFVVERFIEELRRQVIPGVDHAVHSDYSDNGPAQINLAYVPKFPALVILGLTFADSVGRPQGPQDAALGTPGDFARRQEPIVVDVLFELLGLSDNSTELINLMFATRFFFQNNKKLRVARNPLDPSAGVIEYSLDFQFGEPMTVSSGAQDTNANLINFSMGCAVRGVTIDQMPGLPQEGTTDTPVSLEHGGTRGITHTVDEIDITKEKLPRG